ncbi:aspartate/glutamate racemase family protein [Nordella sp. HKS 07]|uniref:maleate cis-trans isomerase family protein n=1 Tax=Nordella sp. HKS 07 TaxID=2712222 RepID=UPI0019D0DB08|nr:aspartate/glutamate racemase family protein [Nordella sp. HKS 07]
MAGKVDPGMQLIEGLPFETDRGIASRARIGLIVLATDYTIEHEWRRIFTGLAGVALYQSRIRNDAQITPETLRAMEPRIAACADVILPGADFDVIAYGCTSAAMAIGEEKVFERIREVRPHVECTTPITAAFAAFRALGARRIGVLTPYRADVNRIVADYIKARGFTVPVFGSFNEENDNLVARIAPKSIKEGILAIRKRAEIDAVFVSCTSIRLAEAAAEIEKEIGIPVTSSNHAMAWHALRLANYDEPLPQWGKLFTLPLAD